MKRCERDSDGNCVGKCGRRGHLGRPLTVSEWLSFFGPDVPGSSASVGRLASGLNDAAFDRALGGDPAAEARQLFARIGSKAKRALARRDEHAISDLDGVSHATRAVLLAKCDKYAADWRIRHGAGS